MFIKVIHGDSGILLVNPESQLQIIMDYLRLKCGLETKNKVDLVPLGEYEETPKLYLRHPKEFLSPYVVDRETYVTAIVTLDRKGDPKMFEPQVQDWTVRFPHLEGKISDILHNRSRITKTLDAQNLLDGKALASSDKSVDHHKSSKKGDKARAKGLSSKKKG